MSTINERAASIRMFTVPEKHGGYDLVRKYAIAAAQWERLRLYDRGNSVLADEERFLTLSAHLQRLSKDLGLRTCAATRDAEPGVSGITDRRGFLPNDPAYLQSDTWREATEKWCLD
jgi:hypothetical protein